MGKVRYQITTEDMCDDVVAFNCKRVHKLGCTIGVESQPAEYEHKLHIWGWGVCAGAAPGKKPQPKECWSKRAGLWVNKGPGGHQRGRKSHLSIFPLLRYSYKEPYNFLGVIMYVDVALPAPFGLLVARSEILHPSTFLPISLVGKLNFITNFLNWSLINLDTFSCHLIHTNAVGFNCTVTSKSQWSVQNILWKAF